MHISELIDMSIKNKKPDLVFKNANIINVFTHEIIKGDVAIHDGIIVGIGNYTGEKNIDVNNKWMFSITRIYRCSCSYRIIHVITKRICKSNCAKGHNYYNCRPS